MYKIKILIIAMIVVAICSYYYFSLEKFLSLEYVQSHLDFMKVYKQQHFEVFAAIFFLTYILVAALSIPGALILTITSGAVFGLFWGIIISSFASSIGATLAFLASRLILREWVQNKYRDYLVPINKGIEKEGAFYLFSIRMIPLFPFFVTNLLMGLTSISVSSFYLVSQIGMFLGTIVYVNAGTELSKITSLSGLLSTPILLSFAFLGMLPLVTKYIVSFIRQRNHEKIH
tara:strand:+ start:395 stop:1087 length:693 start_codon:yes stop_codon:yes gene_type:complete